MLLELEEEKLENSYDKKCDWFSDIERLFSMTDTEIMENIHTFKTLDDECDIKRIVDSCY